MLFNKSLLVLLITLFSMQISANVLLKSSVNHLEDNKDVITLTQEEHRSERLTQQKVVKKRQSNTSDDVPSDTTQGAQGVSDDVTKDAAKDVVKEVPPPKDLCSDPVVYTIDRMSNGTVRIYRENHFWDLDGLPANTSLSGPFLINWDGMAPITEKTKIITAVSGENAMSTYKIENDKFWAYNSQGKLFIGKTGKGESFPVTFGGLTAAFFNGIESKPFMLGFRGVSVFYYKFKGMKWQIDGKSDGYPQGRNDEKFPGDLSTAFAIPLKTGYEAYLFKGDQYCKRREKLKSGKDCDEWKENKRLFGCYSNQESPGAPIKEPGFDGGGGGATKDDKGPVQPTPTTKNGAHYVDISYNLLPLILSAILLRI